MEFKLIVVPPNPAAGELVLKSETPLSGVGFVEAVGAAMRKSIDHIARGKHSILGALPSYEMSVPQAVAIDSGLFTDRTEIYIVVEEDLLSDFIWYSATMSNEATHRPCYPYMTGGATLVSNIDELNFLQIWTELGFPKRIWRAASNDGTSDSYPVASDYTTTDPNANSNGSSGDSDDDENGNGCPNYDPDKCKGCTNFGPHGHHTMPPLPPPHWRPGHHSDSHYDSHRVFKHPPVDPGHCPQKPFAPDYGYYPPNDKPCCPPPPQCPRPPKHEHHRGHGKDDFPNGTCFVDSWGGYAEPQIDRNNPPVGTIAIGNELYSSEGKLTGSGGLNDTAIII